MSSSAPTEEATEGDPAPRRFPVALVASGVAAVMLIAVGALWLLGLTSSSSGAPPKNALVGVRLQTYRFPPLQKVGSRGTIRPDWWSPHGAVLLFFADWCTPCHREVPLIARAVGKGDLRGVRVIGFDEDLSAGVAASFVAANHVRFPVVHDGQLLVSSALVPAGLPATVFVRPSGKVVAVDYTPLSIMQLSAGLSEIVHHRANHS